MKKYIYIDTKIKGVLLQLVKYFDENIFDKHTVVLFKVYKSNNKFIDILNKHTINYMLIRRYKDLPSFEKSIIFYLFNAQSNCRLVAYREAIHVFVTHGESNKISSIKPIIKIYDYIVVAGDGGIDRYLEHQIFYVDDIKRNRLIRMGATFIGNPNYIYNEASKAIVYAPTWEGGVIDENYSSVESETRAFKLLDEYATSHDISEIYIQPHPNMGHRDKKYIFYFRKGIELLLQSGHTVNIVNYTFEFIHKLLFLKYKSKLSFINNLNSQIDIYRGFVDISAMEIQLISVNIPTYVFFRNTNSCIPQNSIIKNHYHRCGIYNFHYKKDIYLDTKVKDYYISYDDENLLKCHKNKKLNWLCDFLFHLKHKTTR